MMAIQAVCDTAQREVVSPFNLPTAIACERGAPYDCGLTRNLHAGHTKEV